MDAPDTIPELIIFLLGGLALFLYGIDLMGRALRKTAGVALRSVFGQVTRNRWRGLLTGTVITGLIQSSSAATVIIVGFITAGLLTFQQSISLILGANIGTTITPQITALKLDQYAVPMLGIGFLLTFITRRQSMRQLGYSIMGFGMLFLGLKLMSFGVSEYTDAIRAWMERFNQDGVWNYLGAFAAAALATAFLQSSSAMVIMIQLLFVQGALPGLNLVIPLILGAEVGTCVTALLASARGSLSAKRAAVAHLTFNLIGFAIASALFTVYLRLIPYTSGDPARQVANTHLIIRLVNVALFIPFTGLFGRLVERIIPGTEKYSAAPEHLETADLDHPEKALANIRLEIRRITVIGLGALDDAVRGFLDRNQKLLDSVLAREEIVDELCKAVTHYTLLLSRRPLPAPLQNQPLLWLHVMSDAERLSDHAENIAQLKDAFPEEEARCSAASIAELEELLSHILRLGEQVTAVLEYASDANVAALVKDKEEINRLVDENLVRHAARIARGETTPIGGILYAEMVTNLRRASSHLRHIAISTGAGGPEMTWLKRRLRETG